MKFSEKLLHAVSELQITPRRNVYTLLAGNYKSPFRGSGMQFKEFRHYEEGDDIRHMSWTVTARTGRATMKVYEEERELNLILAVDVSGSSLFGHGARRKIDMYTELCAVMSLAAVKAGDNLGLLLFNDKVEYFLPPRRTRDHVKVALSKLLEQDPRGKASDLRPALLFLDSVLKSRALIVVISDFFVPPFEQEMKMAGKRHEVLLLHCYDEAERGASLHGVYEVCDPETGEFFLLDANSPQTRMALAKHHAGLAATLRKLSESKRSEYLRLSVEDDYLQKLVRFFRRRNIARG